MNAQLKIVNKSSPVRVPPHSIEAEQSVLGGLLLVPDAYDQVAAILGEDDFYRREHQLIFRAIGELAGVGQPCDAVTLGEWFENHGDATTIGGPAYLAELANNTPSAANIKAYADIVRDKSVLRKLIEAGTQICGDGFAPGARGVPEILDAAEQRVFKIAEAGARGRQQSTSPAALAREVLEDLQWRASHPGELSGVPTHFKQLDEWTSGLQRQDLVIVAGRPSMGKSAFAINIAENAALRAKVPVLVFSLEMGRKSIQQRRLAALTSIDLTRIRDGALASEEWARVVDASALTGSAALEVVEAHSMTPAQMCSRARRFKREHHAVGLIIIDYLQLMTLPARNENRATEVAGITRGLKAMAQELDVPVIALSQLNREVEQRNDKRPVMSDLRESGAIEQDADLILFIYRDEVYNKESRWKGQAELIIGKNRNGPIGTVIVDFIPKYTKFVDHPDGD